MPKNKSAFCRYLIINECLKNNLRPYPNKDYLLVRMGGRGYEVSPSTFNKDISFMRDECGAPIKYDRKRKGYCYSDPEYSFPGVSLTEEEKEALNLSVSVIETLRFIPVYKRYKAAIDKLTSKFRTDKTSVPDPPIQVQVEVPLSGSGSEWFETLYGAITNYNCLRIFYKGFGKPPSSHTISPYALKEYRHYWYVIGHSTEKNHVLVFALNRITEIFPSKGRYIFPTGFKLEEYFRYSLGVTHYHEKKPQAVRLAFHDKAVNYISSMPLHHSQKEIGKSDKGLVIELNVFITPEVISTILSYGSNVTVLGPDNLVKTIKEEIQKSGNRYT